MKLYFGNTVTTITTVMVLGAAGFHRLLGMEPRQHPVLGAQNCIFVCIWIGYLLFCGNAGRAG